MSEPVLFIDRDGVIVKDIGGITKPKEIRLVRQAGKALAEINRNNITVLLIVEQPADLDKLITTQQAYEIETELRRKLARTKASFLTTCICPPPSDSDIDFKKLDFSCRKPNPTLFFTASEKYNIDFSKSAIVTDNFKTLETASNIGLPLGIFIKNKRQEFALVEKNRDKLSPMKIEMFSSIYIARTTITQFFKDTKVIKKRPPSNVESSEVRGVKK